MEEPDINQLLAQLLQTNKEENYLRIKQDMLSALETEKEERSDFEERLYQRWEKGLNFFETILILSRTVGTEFNQKVRPYAVQHNDLIFEVLARIHAQACMMTSAILNLLKSGHPSDALARARTLHELRVIATFIEEGDNNRAERFLLYEVVETFHAMQKYEKYYKKLGYEPLEPGTLEKLGQEVQNYHQKFLSQFHKDVLKGDYGWAAIEIGKIRPTFADIEENVGLAHWRPHYKLACYPTHASAKGIKLDLGKIGNRNYLLAGPINSGFTEPASIALTSFNVISTALFVHTSFLKEKDLLETYLKSLVAAQVLRELVKDAEQAFLETQQQLEREELDKHLQEAKGL